MSLDPKNLIIATAWLKTKATLPTTTPEKPSAYDIDFGQFENLSIKPGGDLKETWNPGAGGGIGLLDVRRTKTTLTYEADLKFLTPAFLANLMGSASGSAPLPGKVFNLYGWLGLQAEDEPIVAAGAGVTNEGAGIIVHHSFKGAFTLDGDLTANGDDFIKAKLTVRVLLAAAPGVWTAGARPLVALTS
jgi:hypothetical protein